MWYEYVRKPTPIIIDVSHILNHSNRNVPTWETHVQTHSDWIPLKLENQRTFDWKFSFLFELMYGTLYYSNVQYTKMDVLCFLYRFYLWNLSEIFSTVSPYPNKCGSKYMANIFDILMGHQLRTMDISKANVIIPTFFEYHSAISNAQYFTHNCGHIPSWKHIIFHDWIQNISRIQNKLIHNKNLFLCCVHYRKSESD